MKKTAVKCDNKYVCKVFPRTASGPDGTVYRQCIAVNQTTFARLRKIASEEIAASLPGKARYVSTPGYEVFMKPLEADDKNPSLCFLNHTQTRFINLLLKADLKNENTFIKITK